jgi:hypothetical protein
MVAAMRRPAESAPALGVTGCHVLLHRAELLLCYTHIHAV